MSLRTPKGDVIFSSFHEGPPKIFRKFWGSKTVSSSRPTWSTFEFLTIQGQIKRPRIKKKKNVMREEEGKGTEKLK